MLRTCAFDCGLFGGRHLWLVLRRSYQVSVTNLNIIMNLVVKFFNVVVTVDELQLRQAVYNGNIERGQYAVSIFCTSCAKM